MSWLELVQADLEQEIEDRKEENFEQLLADAEAAMPELVDLE